MTVAKVLRLLLAGAAALFIVWSFIDVGARALDDPSDGRPTLLRVLYWGDPEEEKIVIQTIEAFERANPDVKVQRIHAGFGTFNQKLNTMMAAGEPPDVFYLSTENLRLLGEMDLVEPLDDYLAEDPVEWFDDFYPVLVDNFTFDADTGVLGEGDLLGLPKDFTTSGFYVNLDLFERAGVEVPYDGWTWEELADAAEKITALRDSENDRIYGVHFNQWPDMIAVQSWNFGGDLFKKNPDGSYDFTQVALGEPPALEMAEFMRRLRFEEGTAFVAAGIARDAGAEFLSGNIGIVGPAGRWMTPQYRPITSFDWDFVPLPTRPGVEPSNGIFTVAWAMSSQSEHKEKSWELLKFLAGPEGQTMIGELGLAIPAMQNIAESDAFLTDQKPQNTQLFLDLVDSGRVIEYPTQTEVKQLIESEYAAATNLNTRTPEQAAANVQRQWTGLLESPLQTQEFKPVAWLPILLVFAFLVLLVGGFLFLKAKREKLGRLDAAQERAGFAFIAPWLIGFALLTAGPMVLSLILAFTKWSAMTPVGDADFVGSANFVQLFRYDETFYQSLWVTLYYVVLAVPITQVAALAVALLMNAAVRGIEVFRTIYFLPSVITGVAMGTLWLALFNDDFGLINEVIRGVGLPAPNWFGEDATWAAIPGFVLMSVWGVGGAMIIYLAGLKGVPPSLYESSTIDGAGPWHRFWNVTLPMLSPLVFFNVVMGIIGSFQVFTQAFVMTGRGPDDSTLFYVLNLYYQAFENHNMGYASAMAWVLFILLLGLTVIVFRASKNMVHYEGLKA